MASFVQGEQDQLAPQQLYKPDYSFLMQSYGAKQAEYDRGFNMVKSLYSSALSGAITNTGNEAHRTEIFKKIQNSLKSTAAVDLSDPTNVLRAKNLMNPITNDEEIMYDMSVTAFHQKQKQIMDSYKNSTDPKMRRLYNEYSQQDIAFAEEQLRNAKRGDGSIKKVQPREFVPFEDVEDYLNKAAKEQGLKIEYSGADGKGYILKRENGEMAEMPFTQWAQTQMGNKFDRQFEVIGRVQAENSIRSLMASNKVNREQALNIMSQKLVTAMTTQETYKQKEATKHLHDLDDKLDWYKHNYNGKIPERLKDKHTTLVNQRDYYKTALTNSNNTIETLATEGKTFTASNLYNIYMNEAKEGTAKMWGKSFADATSKFETTSDSTWVAKAHIASAEKISELNRRQDWAKHKDDMLIAQSKFSLELKKFELEGQKVTLDAQKHKLEIAKVKAEGKIPDEVRLGVTPSTVQMGGVDIMNKDFHNATSQMFNTAFGANDGLINVALNNKGDFGAIYSALVKVKGIAAGQADTLSDTDKTNLKTYANKIGLEIGDVTDVSSANAILEGLAKGTYEKAVEKLKLHNANDKLLSVKGNLDIFSKAAASFSQLASHRDNMDKSYKSIEGLVSNPDGTLKEGFEAAKQIGFTSDGHKIFDLSGLNIEKKVFLDQAVAGEYTKRTRPVSNAYEFTQVSATELATIFSKDAMKTAVDAKGNSIDISELERLNTPDLKKLVGDNVTVNYEPATEMATLTLKISPEEAKKLKVETESVTVSIPYETLQLNPDLERLAQYSKLNTINATSVGIFEPFITNPTATITSPPGMKEAGFDYTIQGAFNSNQQFGLHMTFNYDAKDPKTGKTYKQHYTDFAKIKDPQNASEYQAAESAVHNAFERYIEGRIEFEKSLIDES